jgi:hypothetical protein
MILLLSGNKADRLISQHKEQSLSVNHPQAPDRSRAYRASGLSPSTHSCQMAACYGGDSVLWIAAIPLKPATGARAADSSEIFYVQGNRRCAALSRSVRWTAGLCIVLRKLI